MGIRKLALAVATCACVVAGCSTTTTGTSRFGGSLSDPEPDVSQLRTGNYQIKPSTPFFSAGPNPLTQSIVESTRMAEYVVGPWEIDASVTRPGAIGTGTMTSEFGVDNILGVSKDNVMQGIARAHNLVAGFGSYRSSGSRDSDLEIENAVLMFPDDAQAAAAAGDFTAQFGHIVAAPFPTYPVQISVGVGTVPAVGTDYGTGASGVAAYTAQGRFVLYQFVSARATKSTKAPLRVELLMSDLLGRQQSLIKSFVPTEPAKLADLPKDPSDDQLLSKTITTPDRQQGVLIGTWRPRAWLHFESDPVSMTTQFERAGVQWVTQRWGRVYQAPNADSAAQLLDATSALIMKNPDVQLAGPVPGFPGARCFEHLHDFARSDATVTWRILGWHYSCLARTDRFVFQVFADDETAVDQQISAQYRVLSGK